MPTFRREAQIRAEIEQIVLNVPQPGGDRLRRTGGKHHAEERVEFIDRSVRDDSAVGLGNARAIAERRLTLVSTLGVNAIEIHHWAPTPFTFVDNPFAECLLWPRLWPRFLEHQVGFEGVVGRRLSAPILWTVFDLA